MGKNGGNCCPGGGMPCWWLGSEGAGQGLCIALVCLLSCLVTIPARATGHVVRVGVYQNPPKIFLSHHHVSGIFGDLLQRIADRKDWTLVPVPCQWQQCVALVKSGKIDLLPDVAMTAERQKYMTFSKVTVLYSWSELYRNNKTHLLSVKGLSGKRVAVLAGSVQARFLKELVHNFGLKDVHFIQTGTLEDAFKLTAEGKANIVAANYFYGDAAAQKYHLSDTPVVFQPVRLYFVTPKGQGLALRSAIDQIVDRWQADSNSPYYEIVRHWRVSPQYPGIPDVVWWGVSVLVGLLLLTGFLTWLLRRTVVKKTRDLRISEFKQAVIMDSVDAFIYIKGLDHRYQYVNKKAAEFFHRPAEALIGKRDDELFEADTVKRIREIDESVIQAGQPLTSEEPYLRQEHIEERTFLTIRQPLRDDAGRIYAICGIATDFTEHKRNEDKIHELAFYDALTGLPNRTLLLDRARHALLNHARSGSDGALLFIDLDNFKMLNDTMGHAKGDLLLQQVAARLKEHVRKNDTLARLGGDEFVLLMEQLGQDYEEIVGDVVMVANTLRRALADQPFQLGNMAYNVTGSIGVALFSDARQGDNELYDDELLKLADLAMYASKSEGRNQVRLFNPHMQTVIAKRVEMESLLNEAIRLEQFHLAYQPIVDSAGKLVGAESLVRWHHPEKGEIQPSDFIPYAEATGQIIPLGHWIMRAACRQLAIWRQESENRNLFLSVNVSAKQFYHPDFVHDVIDLIEETGANPQQLEMELTESLLAHDIESLIKKMNSLKEIGVRFSLDDFGTGYSSLTYLKRLPLDQLKIDQSFVRDLLVDPNDKAIIRTVLALGNSLDLSVIAEGVEKAEQRDALLRMGCQRLQGFLFGYPGPPATLRSASRTGDSSANPPGIWVASSPPG